ncbi:MAG TPA: DegT/DnrJ/EryC1/StrS family aminotransferase [Gemmataceae bacterium]|jgi:dTDP-4-amino-4,6-dideoxygalactose transaminase
MQTERLVPVPLCDLQTQYRALQPQIEAAVLRVLASGQAILGPEVAALEREVADYCGAAHAVGCGSGTDALSLALHALDVGPGDEVILPPFTFFATAGSVVRTGARPVFADIDPDTYNIDPAAVERAVTPRTKAILPVHLYGQCCDMDALWRVAERHGLPVIEDAAQAFGSDYQGKRTGTLGAVACLSFYPTKNLGTYGDAGMVVTNDPEWAERMVTLRVHGMKPKYHHPVLGWNARLDALHAAILRVKLPHVDSWIERRRAAAGRYDELIAGRGLDGFLTRPVRRPDRRHTFNQYVCRVAGARRDALVKHFQAEKIGCEVYYPVPLHLQGCLWQLGHRAGEFPVSEAACRDVIALPIFPEITPTQQERVVDAVAAFARGQTRMAA